MLRPRDSHDLRLIQTNLNLSPPATLRWSHDVFGFIGKPCRRAARLASSPAVEWRVHRGAAARFPAGRPEGHRACASDAACGLSQDPGSADASEQKVEHRNLVKDLTDEELDAAIEHLRAMLAAQAGEGAKVIEGAAETVALPAPAEVEPERKRPNRLLEHADTAVGPRERKPRKRVPSPVGA
jgi:hypothetical protein